jgi:ABC-type branched-subunit amino acid transport system substrate-binding protein
MRRAAIVGLWIALAQAQAADLSPRELRGRAIYRTGKSPSGERIAAFLGGGATEVDAAVVPCAGCHGLDGRGRVEGGIAPPPIRWQDLEHRRPAYTERLLVRAIAMGLGPAGARLNDAMPRFALSQTDAGDLVAYLKSIAADHDPGISDDAVRVGVLLPPDGIAIRAALSAYFAEVNGRGGVYRRRVDLVFGESPAATLAEFLPHEAVFALLSTYIAGSENEVPALLAAEKIPVAGAWTLLQDSRTDPFVFYLDSGLRGQVAALAEFVLRKFASRSRFALIGSNDELSAAAAESVRSKIPESRLSSALSGEAAFVSLREKELLEFVNGQKRAEWRPALLLPGSLATAAALRELQSYPAPVFLAVPSPPSEATREALAEYAKLKAAFHLPDQRIAAQFKALAEAAILLEGLKRAGRDLSREGLIHSLEGLYDFACGFAPAVTFGPNRRAGSDRFRIVRLDPKTGALSGAN